MKFLICILLAYLIGSLSPSALIAKIKHKDLKKEGTGNLGATNTALVFGQAFGLIVMVFDLFKGFLAVKISVWIIPGAKWFALHVIVYDDSFYSKCKTGNQWSIAKKQRYSEKQSFQNK